ncbi:AraC family transcriptional regulator [Diaphorobacter sp. HDW4B]|uniref:helix-turn-helix transcriptional regulator n=1 Tax=Diaphorobacter sp. HDW4B TaxID=2714925 RepID=UPI00140E7231|nr:AraC family transcriptional regulator [Diaphorobacter sp. HDW4B]QIL72997.1 AraC family transcriptional regulator [Diaphorobacter sp. HDW4B]
MENAVGAASDAPNTLWIRTEPIRTAPALRAFQEDFMQLLGGIQVEPLHSQPLSMNGSITLFGSTMIGSFQTTPTRCIHPSNARMDDNVVLYGWAKGQGSLRATGQQWDFGEGDAMLSQMGLPETATHHTLSDLWSVSLSRSMLASMRIDVDAALLRPLRNNAAAHMLMGYAQLLSEHCALATPELRRAAHLHLHDLAALAVGALGESAQLAQSRGARAARVLTIREDIARHFTDAALSVSAVALRQGISPRYLHLLLEREGLSFSALVLEHRLTLAHQLLRDARLMARSISDIAFDVGFGDLSYFNRSFRRRFEATPSDVREASRSVLQATLTPLQNAPASSRTPSAQV